jgi:hypothetical protein
MQSVFLFALTLSLSLYIAVRLHILANSYNLLLDMCSKSAQYAKLMNHLKDAVQSDLHMCTKEPSFYLQTVYLGFYFILCSCKA